MSSSSTGSSNHCFVLSCENSTTFIHIGTGLLSCSEHTSQIHLVTDSSSSKPKKTFLEHLEQLRIETMENPVRDALLDYEDPASNLEESNPKKITPFCVGCSLIACVGSIVGVYFAVLGTME